jgi:hypothetical protein
MTTVVECSNCTSGGNGGPAPWLSIGIAALALVATLIALGMNYRQFREFNRRSKARARFKVSLSVANGVGGIRWTPVNTDKAYVIVGIGIKNYGDKAAGETLINALYPAHIKEARWSRPNGGEVEENGTPLPAEEGDLVVDPETDAGYESKYLARTIPRIGTKPHTLVHFKFPVDDLKSVEEARIPLRVKVQADEIPDDIEEYEETMVVIVRKGPEP